MTSSLFEQIDNKLSELLQLVEEDTYNHFLLGDPIMKIYDEVSSLDNHENILTDEILNKILNLIQAKIDMYK